LCLVSPRCRRWSRRSRPRPNLQIWRCSRHGHR
jgi:hypothetical protein